MTEQRTRTTHGIDLSHAETPTPKHDIATVELPEKYQAAHLRGAYLLDMEKESVEKLGVPVAVYLWPVQDKNAIRKFRGVTVKE